MSEFSGFQGDSAASATAASVDTSADSPSVSANDDSPFDTNAGMSDSGIPQDTDATASPAADAPDAILQEIDPALLSEKASKAFAYLRTTNQDLAQFRTDAEPLYQWATERGGHERIRGDVEFVDALFAEPPDSEADPQGYENHRVSVHSSFYQQSPDAYLRFVDDIRKDGSTRQFWLEQEGITDDDLALAKELRANPERLGQIQQPQVDAELLNSIPPQLRETFQSLPRDVQEDLALRAEGVRNWDLQQYANAQAVEKQRQSEQAERAARAEAERKAQIATRKNQVYSDVRTIIGQKVAKFFPQDQDTQTDLVNAIEAAFLGDPKGAQLWKQFETWAEAGEMRRINDQMLNLITNVETVAAPRIERMLAKFEKARKWDEYQRSIGADQEHIEPQHGDAVRPGNGRVRDESVRGQYDPRNVVNYFPRGN